MLERAVELVHREPCSRRRKIERARVDRAGAGRHRHALERREAHRRVDRAAVEHGCDRAASAEVADDEPLAPRTCSAAHCDGEAVEPVAANAPGSRQRAGIAYVAASRGSVAWNAVSKTATCGTSGALAAPARSPRARGVVERRERRQLPSACSTAASIDDRLAEPRPPPCTTRWPTASAVDEARRPRADRSSPSTRRELQAGRARVDDEDARVERPRPVADVRVVLAVLAGPRPRSSRRSTISWRRCAGPPPRPGTRSITSMTRWKRSRSLSMTMSNGVVVVPSSL